MSLLSRLRARPVRPAPEVGEPDLAPERAAQPRHEPAPPAAPAAPVRIEREHLGGGRYRVRRPIEDLVAQRRGGRAPVGFRPTLGGGDPRARAARHLGYRPGAVLWPDDAQ